MMAKLDCEVCRGNGTIRLPLHTHSVLSFGAINPSVAIEDISRTYPCPECSERVPQDRVAVLRHLVEIDVCHDTSAIMDIARQQSVRALAEEMLRGDFVSFVRAPPNECTLTFKVYATVGVVSQAAVATIEERAAERQDEFAQEVVREASAQILNSGGDGSIRKSDAARFVGEALEAVAQRRAAMVPV